MVNGPPPSPIGERPHSPAPPPSRRSDIDYDIDTDTDHDSDIGQYFWIGAILGLW